MANFGERYDIIHYIKGIAILLVVVGHYLPPGAPAAWTQLHAALYTFHMPVFFAVSGFLFFGTLRRRHGGAAEILRRKFRRLGVPFVSIALLFFVIKYGAGFVFRLDNPPTPWAFFTVFVSPLHSYMPLLWFMYSLFTMMAAFLLLRRACPPAVLLVLAAAFSVAFPYDGTWFSLSGTIRNFPYFLGGYCLAVLEPRPATLRRIGAFWPLFLAIFLAVFFVYSAHDRFGDALRTQAVSQLLLGALGIALTVRLADALQRFAAMCFFRALGVHSMTIYLFHTLFESFVRHALAPRLPPGEGAFLAGAAVAVCAGVLFPLLLEKYVLCRYRLTRVAILGLSGGGPGAE